MTVPAQLINSSHRLQIEFQRLHRQALPITGRNALKKFLDLLSEVARQSGARNLWTVHLNRPSLPGDLSSGTGAGSESTLSATGVSAEQTSVDANGAGAGGLEDDEVATDPAVVRTRLQALLSSYPHGIRAAK